MGLLRIIKYHMRSNRKRRRNKVRYVSIIKECGKKRVGNGWSWK